GCAVTCVYSPDELQALAEWRFDLDNIAANGFDLRPEVKAQGWEEYFNRLRGPVYIKLVKEFWKHADCDDNQVVSYIAGRRIIVTEKSIVDLLGENT
ncbi:hypothetical protein, partial [Bacillus cereus]|uniref:hypothetical protein n=1 Tax=Bacillus cereus TaxID=1396 RepID=UPI0034D5F693